jgi:endonuclease-3
MSDEQKIREIYEWLQERYGEAPEPSEMSGVDYVIETILSQNTNDINRDKAFNKLKDKYGDNYESIQNAPREELIETIRIAGLGPTKAERIQEALEIIYDKADGYSVEFLDDMSLEEAKKWLTDIPGIGPKTASVILGFHFKKPTIPVDTHVHRLAGRYGLVPEGSSRTKTHNVLEEKVPDEIKYGFHRLLIEHGREECTARNKNCDCELCQNYRE